MFISNINTIMPNFGSQNIEVETGGQMKEIDIFSKIMGNPEIHFFFIFPCLLRGAATRSETSILNTRIYKFMA